MVDIITSALLICGMGLLKVVKSANISVQPGENVTMWCQHNLGFGNNVYWFKQKNSAVPRTIVFMMMGYDLQILYTNYLNDFDSHRFVMSLNKENTSLSILKADFSDPGLYYCGWANWGITFGDGTHLDVRVRGVTPLKNETEITNEVLTDVKQRREISAKDCPGKIFHTLTFILGGIIVILIIISLTLLIIKIRKQRKREQRKRAVDQDATQHHEEPYTSIYAALQFSRQKSRRAARLTEETDVIYSATR